MSFSVKAGASPNQTATPTPSPIAAPYISPNLGPTSHGNNSNNASRSTPPFRPVGASGSNGSTPNFGSAPAPSYPPPFTLTAAAGQVDGDGPQQPQQRRGTDPTKYKTSICRNWEQTGSCSFRGCTFAHGVDELRAPQRPGAQGTSPVLGPMSGGGNPNSTPNGGGGNSPTPPMALGNSPTLGPSIVGGTHRIEQLLELLQHEIAKERDLVAVHAEANRTLEAMLRREQTLRQETREQIDTAEREIVTLRQQLHDRESQLARATGQPIQGSVDSGDGLQLASFASNFSRKPGESVANNGSFSGGNASAPTMPAALGDEPVSQPIGMEAADGSDRVKNILQALNPEQ